MGLSVISERTFSNPTQLNHGDHEYTQKQTHLRLSETKVRIPQLTFCQLPFDIPIRSTGDSFSNCGSQGPHSPILSRLQLDSLRNMHSRLMFFIGYQHFQFLSIIYIYIYIYNGPTHILVGQIWGCFLCDSDVLQVSSMKKSCAHLVHRCAASRDEDERFSRKWMVTFQCLWHYPFKKTDLSPVDFVEQRVLDQCVGLRYIRYPSRNRCLDPARRCGRMPFMQSSL